VCRAGLVIVRSGLARLSSPSTTTLALAAGIRSGATTGSLRPSCRCKPIIVTAAKRSQLLSQALTSVALVTPDTAVARRAVTTVETEAVEQGARRAVLNGQVNIRGSSGYVQGLGSRVLMLVDGVPGEPRGSRWDQLGPGPVEDVTPRRGGEGGGLSALRLGPAWDGVVT